ncbi:MAG: response regulator, partial [Gemmatimonadaceae bacterium]|nr:response regulator [Gemmatimonadaceae bacterium]
MPLILVVEDSATQAAALAELLERSGFSTVTARNAEMALDLLARQSVDLVLSDVVMPGMDGYELAKRIRSMPALSDQPIVLLTSLTDPLAIVRGLESGADHYVTKPYEPSGLLARVRTVLERRNDVRLRPKPITIELLDTTFEISATKEQILELLVSSYSDLMRTSEAVRDAERRARFLAEATELLSSTLDVQNVLADLARLVVPRIADLCTADLTGPGNATRRIEIAHRFSDSPTSETLEPHTQQEELSGMAKRAIDDGSIQLVPIATDEMLADLARNPELLAELRQNGPFGLLVAPLIARRGAIGFLQFLSADLNRLTAPESMLLIEDLARRAALAVDNALLYSEAQRATTARDDMLAIVSHDLRNP